jgi:flagellar biosynthesis GTPase FlhF
VLRYGQILGLPVTVAYSPDDLSTALDAAPARRVMLVDTPACRLRAGGASEALSLDESSAELVNLLGVAPNRLVVLTVAASSSATDLNRLAAAGRALGAVAAAVTKIDEAATPDVTDGSSAGAALNVLAHLGLPALLLSTGRDVLAEVSNATPTDLAVTAFEAALRG